MDVLDDPPRSLALTASLYRTRVTIVSITATGPFRILTADPSRWFVRFQGIQGGNVLPQVVPGPFPTGWTGTVSNYEPTEYKFRDCPSIVAGEFYSNVSIAPQSIMVIEVVFLR